MTTVQPLIGKGPDAESRAWVAELHADGPRREAAIGRLAELLLGATRAELRRRCAHLEPLRSGEAEAIACQSADDALIAVLGRLDTYRGASRFTTWAYKFALLEAAVAMRRRRWQDREVVLRPAAWELLDDGTNPVGDDAETAEILAATVHAIHTDLTPHQREVLIALALDGVPIDVLAERLATTRGALYASLRDARRNLRAKLSEVGLTPDPASGDPAPGAVASDAGV